MARIERYSLMNREHEVLEFDIDLDALAVTNVMPAAGAAWAPHALRPLIGRGEVKNGLFWFLQRRALSRRRSDLADVLAATGMPNAIELALRAGGFSLSDQYWYRACGSDATWEHDNFFDNAWDPAFGQALLDHDYRALAEAPLRTPDVTVNGKCVKAWVPAPEGPRMLKASTCEVPCDIVCEAIASRLLTRLLSEDDCVPRAIVERKGELLVSCPAMIGRDEEYVSAVDVMMAAGVDMGVNGEKTISQTADSYLRLLEDLHVPGAGQSVSKRMVASVLLLDADVNPNNFGLIRNLMTGALRPAPLFDLGRAFGVFEPESMRVALKHPQLALLMVANKFNFLKPSWDYSWFEPSRLDGFEEEFRGDLARYDLLPQGLADLIAKTLCSQLSYVADVAAESRRQLRG